MGFRVRRHWSPSEGRGRLGGGSPSHPCPHLPRSGRQPAPAGSRRSQEHAAPVRVPAAAPGPAAAAAHGNPPASAVANMAALSGNPTPSPSLSRRPRARPRPAPPPSASPRPSHAPSALPLTPPWFSLSKPHPQPRLPPIRTALLANPLCPEL